MSHPDWFTQGYEHIWLPYAQMQISPAPLPVKQTKGVHIHLEDGRKLIDGIASWWTACHGYNHPHIIEAITKQAERMPHVMFAGLAHEQAYTLATRLAQIAPEGLTRAFFSDSGSTATEVAMKMAVQYWRNNGEKKKNRFIAFRGGYHGDTAGAMSLSDPESWVHKTFSGYMPMQYVMDIPSGEYSLEEFISTLDGIKHTVAGLVIEPLVQGAGGMRFYSADILAEIHAQCKKHDILFIADEIATGFGRTGTMFACEEAGISPDLMCVGKALTGGAIPLAATLAQESIFEAFLGDTMQQALMHGPTYMANPLACAAANASLDLFEQEPRLKQIEQIETTMHETLSPLEALPHIKDVRVKGAIAAIQLTQAHWPTMFALREEFIKHGVWLRPFLDIIYLMPSFTITEPELSQLLETVIKITKNEKLFSFHR